MPVAAGVHDWACRRRVGRSFFKRPLGNQRAGGCLSGQGNTATSSATSAP
jgi:hypothetical protein